MSDTQPRNDPEPTENTSGQPEITFAPGGAIQRLKEKYGVPESEIRALFRRARPPSTREAVDDEDDIGADFASIMGGRGGGNMQEVMAFVLYSDAMERREERREERLWRQKQREREEGPNRHSSPETESLKTEMGSVKASLEELTGTLAKKERDEQQEALLSGVAQSVTSEITPVLQELHSKVAGLEKALETRSAENTPGQSLASELKAAIDALGEKIASKSSNEKITMNDLDSVLETVDKIAEKFRKEPTGEIDYKVAGINVIGEVGKEFINAYRDIETGKHGTSSGASSTARNVTPPNQMRNIIKRQVQAYIMQLMQGGVAQLNLEKAAQDLGLTEKQILDAYNELKADGFVQAKGSKQEAESDVGETTQQPGKAAANDQIFS